MALENVAAAADKLVSTQGKIARNVLLGVVLGPPAPAQPLAALAVGRKVDADARPEFAGARAQRRGEGQEKEDDCSRGRASVAQTRTPVGSETYLP